VQQRSRVFHPRITRLISHKFDITAEKNQGKTIVCIAAPEPEKSRPEADAEDINANIEQAGCPEVTQFVDEDHYADQNQQPPEIQK
jgi:hypothetical protein